MQSRRLLATPYLTYSARRRRALLQGESEGGGAGLSAGCFPDIYTAQDFENWLEGSYIGQQHQTAGCLGCPFYADHVASLM